MARQAFGFRVALAALFAAGPARADEVAPMRATQTMRSEAEGQLASLVGALSTNEQLKVSGIYVVFDERTTELAALPACDDDGDYVIVVTDALLQLAESLAYVRATDYLHGTRLASDYASLLARSQRTDVAPLPPPVASRDLGVERAALEEASRGIYDDLVTWLLAGELAHAVAGDLVCPNPTPTREAADDTWTQAEHDAAFSGARSRMVNLRAADTWATTALLTLGRSEVGPLAWLTLLAPLEDSHRRGTLPSYFALHPETTRRFATVRSAVDAWAEHHPTRCESCREEARMR